MLLKTKYHWFGLTSLVLAIAAPSYLAFAEPATGVVTSNPDASVANYGRAGGQASLSTEPTPLPQPLINAYEQTKASVERAYEKSREFLAESAQGRVRAAQASEREQGEAIPRKSVTSGGGIGAFGRAGKQDYLSSAPPRQPPQIFSDAYDKTKAFVKHAYDKTSQFLTQSSQRPTGEQPSSLSGT